MYNIKDSSVCFTRLYVRFGILFTCRKHLHERIILLRGDGWVHRTS